MNFADITYSLPLANIFSGLEPSLAVILACVPLLRPLLGRSGNDSNPRSTPYQVSGPSRRGKLNHNQFGPLNDDASHHRLHPIGTKHEAEIGTFNGDQGEGHFASDVDSMETGEREAKAGRGKTLSRINVKREWAVSGKRN
jgi:hypothetical protein